MNKILRQVIPVLALAVFLHAGFAGAQSGLSVTLTPPLYQLAIGPGENWSSSLKIVNNNGYDVTYYAQVVDMEASGETGQSRFIPLLGRQDPALVNSQLARWITLEATPITIKAGRSENLHFNVSVPKKAEPGGHYAAILVGTQPLATTTSGSQMRISSYVSSLLFVRISGDVTESGRIREFTAENTLYQTPNVDFVLRFENTGNTHLKPEGEVTIYNMWGKKRGQLLINRDANFGNVLPQSIRRFQFTWEGEENVFDIGRYSAEVTLAFGEDGRKNISATTYFWVVPLVPVSVTLAALVSCILLLSWFIRRYIRRALMLERERYGNPASAPAAQAQPLLETMMEPLREGVVDLRKMRGAAPPTLMEGASKPAYPEKVSGLTKGEFLRKYRLFFIFIAVLLFTSAVLWTYLTKVLVPERNFNIKTVDSEAETMGQ